MARRLKTATDIRRYLADLLNRIESGETDPQIASKCGYISNILLKAIELGSFESRIEALENQKNEEPTITAGDPRNSTDFL
jgi:hypothetical protein